MAIGPEISRAQQLEVFDAVQPEFATEFEVISRRAPSAGVVFGVAVVVLIGLAWSAANNDTGTPVAKTAPAEESNEAGLALTVAGNIPWPRSPVDHDPHVVGRPGSNQPVRPWLEAQTLVYVNEIGRPTVINMSTGDQRELVIAPGRNSDRFLIEDGRLVTDDPELTQLPFSQGPFFEVTVFRTGLSSVARPGPLRPAGPTLCLDVNGCAGSLVTQGGFSLVSGKALVIGSGFPEPAEVISGILDSGSWATKGRWTSYSLSVDDPTIEIRIPTPMSTTVVWMIEQADS